MAKVKTANQQNDTLYNEALDSLKKLNEEVLLNKMNEDFNKLINGLRDEVANFSDAIKSDFALLNGNVHMSLTKTENCSNDTILKIQENSDFFYEKLQGFSKFFQDVIAKLVQVHSELNNALVADIQSSIKNYNTSFAEINAKHEALTNKANDQNVQLVQLVNLFSSDITNNKTMLDNINTNWLNSIKELTTDLQIEFKKLELQIEGSQSFYETVKSEVLEEVAVLVALNKQVAEQMKLNMDTNEKIKQELIESTHALTEDIKNELKLNSNHLLKLLEDSKVELEQANTQYFNKNEVLFQQLLKQNELLQQQVSTQQALIEKNAKTYKWLQIVTLTGVVIVIVLKFIL